MVVLSALLCPCLAAHKRRSMTPTTPRSLAGDMEVAAGDPGADLAEEEPPAKRAAQGWCCQGCCNDTWCPRCDAPAARCMAYWILSHLVHVDVLAPPQCPCGNVWAPALLGQHTTWLQCGAYWVQHSCGACLCCAVGSTTPAAADASLSLVSLAATQGPAAMDWQAPGAQTEGEWVGVGGAR
jgi:hypothetical protein